VLFFVYYAHLDKLAIQGRMGITRVLAVIIHRSIIDISIADLVVVSLISLHHVLPDEA
jgi:hypothetical protein